MRIPFPARTPLPALFGALLALCLVFGTPSRGSAQVALSNSWAGVGRTPTLIANVQGAPGSTPGTFAGYFGVSSANFTCSGEVSSLYNKKDAAGNMYSVVLASGAYYPIVNGVQSARPIIANFVFSMQKMANGAQWEGFSAYNYYTGAPLFSTGATRDGSPYALPVMRGSLSIGL